MASINTQTLRGAVYGISAAAIWGGMYIVSDKVLHVIPPFTLLTIRLLLGALILGLLLGKNIVIPRSDIFRLLGVGIVGYGLSLGAQFVGTHLAGGVNGAIVTSASPAFIVLFAAVLLHEPLTPARIGAIVLASIGVLIILDLAHFDLSSDKFGGNLILIVAAVTWGLYSVLVRLVSRNMPTLTISFYALLGGLILALPAAALELQSQPIGEITPGVILGILYLGIISTALAMFLWNQAFVLVEASVASLFFFAQPLVGVLLGSVVLQQPITLQIVIGGILIMTGVLLSVLRQPAIE